LLAGIAFGLVCFKAARCLKDRHNSPRPSVAAELALGHHEVMALMMCALSHDPEIPKP